MSYLNLNGLQYFFNKYIKPLMQGKQDTIEGAASTITGSNLTANRALVSNGSGKVAVSAVTSTELGYLDGVTSGIQGQLNGKQGTVTGGASTITGSNLTANRALVSNGSGKVAVSAVTSTELGYLDGVTSGIQGQINSLNNNLTSRLNGVKLKGGTKIISGNGATASGLFSVSEVNGFFGTSYPSTGTNYIGSHIAIFASNGDASANDAHIDCVTYDPDKSMFLATFDRAARGNIRVCYLAVCF